MLHSTFKAFVILIFLASSALGQTAVTGWRFPAPGWTPIVDVSEGRVWFDVGDGLLAAFATSDKAVVRLPQTGPLVFNGIVQRWILANNVITHTFALDNQSRAPQANIAIEYAAPTSRVVFVYLVLDWSSQKCWARVFVADDFKTATVTLSCRSNQPSYRGVMYGG